MPKPCSHIDAAELQQLDSLNPLSIAHIVFCPPGTRVSIAQQVQGEPGWQQCPPTCNMSLAFFEIAFSIQLVNFKWLVITGLLIVSGKSL